jgi:hypothetical protein
MLKCVVKIPAVMTALYIFCNDEVETCRIPVERIILKKNIFIAIASFRPS